VGKRRKQDGPDLGTRRGGGKDTAGTTGALRGERGKENQQCACATEALKDTIQKPYEVAKKEEGMREGRPRNLQILDERGVTERGSWCVEGEVG